MPKTSKQREFISETASKMTELARLGQSVWLDSIDRRLLASGQLRKLAEQGLRGLTSNPSIFEKAIGESTDYDDRIRWLLSRGDLEVKELFDELSVLEIQEAADIMAPVYAQPATPSGVRDGLVSLELAPFLAHDAEGSVVEARRLCKKTDRPNLMIKVPGTPEGLSAFERLISEGINVNITLLFSQKVYRSFAEAYLRALDDRVSRGLPIASISSVASFFVSRIDTEVDKRLSSPFQAPLRGRVAIANAKCAYQIYLELFQGPRWARLREAGAQPQRLLWASTSTKNPHYRDVLYVEELVGRDTVNTIPPATLQAFEDHGLVRPSLGEAVDEARDTLSLLEKAGISLDEVTDKLTHDGIEKFSEPYGRLMSVLEKKRRARLRKPLNAMDLRVPILMESEVGNLLRLWADEDRVRRLWNGDSSLWTGSGENDWLGWLDVMQPGQSESFKSFQKALCEPSFEDVVVLGMGGSSLCAELIGSLFDPAEGYPVLHVLDSTDPAQVRALESKLDPARTLFIVSSKSGTTLEPNLFLDYFHERATQLLGPNAGQNFIAITDPGTALEHEAGKRGFWRVFHGVPSIGGRYSALSDFGLVPAASMGLDVGELLLHARLMANSCSPNVPAEDNPGLVLGAVLGTLGKTGRNKITLLCSPEVWEFGDWAEQLLAESTGKQGTGLVPVCGEKIGAPNVYGNDRLFVYLRLDGSIDRDTDAKVAALEDAGFPVVRIELRNCESIAQEFFRWEFAVAVAGAILGINPFDQPDVESAKKEARSLMAEFEKRGSLPGTHALSIRDDISAFADSDNARVLSAAVTQKGEQITPRALLQAHLERLKPGDYFAILAFLPNDPTSDPANDLEIERILDAFRHRIRDNRVVATTLGFGPRYLHSTGQIHKGGPDSGVFLQITCDHRRDIAIPGRRYGFGVVEDAQALGDFEVLARKHRRILRIHLRELSSLSRLEEML